MWVLPARESDVAVILRRGPSKHVLAIRWHRNDDTFYFGQWFKGRIYEHSCDLSPRGELLLYFAASHKGPMFSWSAISRPPYLTALALWPKGDCGCGGGWFESEHEIALNHFGPIPPFLADSFSLPKRFNVVPFPGVPGCAFGEEFRLVRDGWTLDAPGRFRGIIEEVKSPRTWSKPQSRGERLRLQLSFVGYAGPRASRPVMIASVLAGHSVLLDLGEIDWVDWDRNGDLLSSKAGCIFRHKFHRDQFTEPMCLLDATGFEFRGLKPSKEALTWNQPLPLERLLKAPLLSTAE